MSTSSEQRSFAETGTVRGTTCGHCASSVTEEPGALSGFRQVHVDLASGRVDVESDRLFDYAALDAAVSEAGFTRVWSSLPHALSR
jgi:copper chaperone CopZ